MKSSSLITFILILFILASGCQNRGAGGRQSAEEDTAAMVPDTGFTGIGVYRSGSMVSAEVTMKNGIRHGIMRTYYPSGKLRQTFWYENGMREDTAIWYHEDGVIFRKTPFRHDSINGIQIQYYRTGKVRAKLEFVDGLRTPFLEEFNSNGRLLTSYPQLVVRTKDEYNTNGTFNIFVELDKKDVKANYYRGELKNNLFNPKECIKINDSETTGYLQLRKTGNNNPGYVGIIAEILTGLGNRKIVYKRIDLPYSDLN